MSNLQEYKIEFYLHKSGKQANLSKTEIYLKCVVYMLFLNSNHHGNICREGIKRRGGEASWQFEFLKSKDAFKCLAMRMSNFEIHEKKVHIGLPKFTKNGYVL